MFEPAFDPTVIRSKFTSMKHTFLTLASTLLIFTAQAQKAEKVYGVARIDKPMSWYKEQSAAWKKIIDQDPKNAEAWYNYYYANRTLNYNDHEDKRSQEEKTKAIDKLIDDMGKNIPESYEYNLCKWAAGGFDMDLLPYLKKADALGTNRTEHLDFMINISEHERNTKQRDEYALKKFNTGNESAGMMYYNYNVIKGLAPNAILLTCGDNDTYPIWILQAQGIRKDITVINLYLIQIEAYRNKVFAELGIDKMDTNLPGTKEKPADKEDYEKFEKTIIKHIAGNKKNYPVYVALTAASEGYSQSVQDKLYLTGSAYLYSNESIDNMALLKRNFEQNYALDYLEHSFYQDISADKVKLINTNYLVPMLTLFDHYAAAGDKQKQEWIRQKIMAVSKGTEQEADVKKHLDKTAGN